MKAIIPFLMTILICSCSATAPVKKEPAKANPQLHQELKAAENAAKAGETKKAMARAKKVIQAQPDSELVDDAEFLMGSLYYNNQQYNEALNSFSTIVRS